MPNIYLVKFICCYKLQITVNKHMKIIDRTSFFNQNILNY